MLGTNGHHPATIHTVDGRKIADLPSGVLPAMMWSREAEEVSRCEFTIHNQAQDIAEEIRPWYHWVTIWDAHVPVWTGPIQRVLIGTDLTQVSARDTSTFCWRTRTPVTKTWQDRDPSVIAVEMWEAMLSLHHVKAKPVIRSDASGDTFTYSAAVDARMMNQIMDDLTKIGLKWSVVAGTPVFGPMPVNPIAQLTERDFHTEIQLLRDGVGTFNDVRVQGKNYAATHIEELGGMNLQTLVSMDDMFGVSNIQKATAQYARQVSQIQNVLMVPGGASLDLDVDLTLDDLVPGNVFSVYARSVSNLMRLTSVEVSSSPGTYEVQVTLESIFDQAELITKGIGNTL